jgi:serine/threonine protein kinase
MARLTKQQADDALELHFLKELEDQALRNRVLKKREELEAKTGKPIALLQAWGVIDHTYRPGTPEYKEVMKNLFRITNDQQISRKIAGDRQQARTMDGAGPVQQGSNLTMDDGANEYIRDLDAGNTLPGTKANGIPSKAPDVNQDEKATFIIPKKDKSESGDLSASLDGEDMVSLNVGSSGDEDYERYERTGELGVGGIGRVYSGKDHKLGIEVAIKTLLPQHATNPRSLQRFTEEGKTNARLGVHPNVAGVQNINIAQEEKEIVMDKIEGEDLADILDKIARDEQYDKKRTYREAYPLSELLQIFLKICDGISYAHKNGVIHRDLKPSQIMVGQTGEVYVMDWGLAKKIGDAEDVNKEAVKKTLENMQQQQDTGLTMEGDVVGTPLYMPPEQAKGELDKINETSDIYSLGAILYEILMLTPPVSGESPINVVFSAAQNNIDEMDDDISKELQAITMKALSGKQRDRYRTADGLKQDVMRYINNQKVQAYDYGPLEKFIKWVQNHPTKTVGALAASVVLFGAGIAGTAVSSLSAQAKSAEATAAKADSKAAKAEAKTAKVEKEKVELGRQKDKEKREAEDLAREEVENKKNEAEKKTQIGYFFYNKGKYFESIHVYNSALETDSKNAKAFHNRALSLRDYLTSSKEIVLSDKRKNKNVPPSLEIIASALNLDKKDLIKLSEKELKTKIQKQAIEDIERATKEDDDNTLYQNELAYTLEVFGKISEAEKQYLFAINKPKSRGEKPHPLAILSLGSFYSRLVLSKDTEEHKKPEYIRKAIQRYDDYLDIFSLDGESHADIANRLNNLRRNEAYPEAIEKSQKAINLGYKEAHYELAAAYYGQKNFKKAEPLFRKARVHNQKNRPDRLPVIDFALKEIQKWNDKYK